MFGEPQVVDNNLAPNPVSVYLVQSGSPVTDVSFNFYFSKVLWMDDSNNVLFYNDVKMIDNMRYTLSKLSRNWDLVIRNVSESDEGIYRCVANTGPVNLKFYKLTVFGKIT